jgi:glycosyltransferase involved in cell wall biosynthesis
MRFVRGEPRRPKLLVLTQHYRPEPNFITADVAEALTEAYDVTVITAVPNYPEGRFQSGFTAWPSRCIENGVTVWRLPLVPYRGLSLIRRAAMYLSFALAAGLSAPVLAPRPDIVWVYHGPFTVGIAALWFRLIGSRIAFTCADLWPESFIATGVVKPGLVERLLYAYSRAINRIADVLICTTRGTLQRYKHDGISADALTYVPVWVDGIPSIRMSLAEQGDAVPNIVYAGNLGPAQRLETLVLAAAQLDREGVAVRFDVYGTGSSERKLRALAEAESASNLRFHGRVDPQEAFERAASATGQLVSLRPTPLLARTIPSKLLFSFAAASPILYGLPGEAGALVAESGGGVVFDPADPDSLVEAVKTLLSLSADARATIRGNLRQYYERHFERTRLLEKYREIFDHLADPACDLRDVFRGATSNAVPFVPNVVRRDSS